MADDLTRPLSSLTTTATASPLPLADLAKRINAQHDEVKKAVWHGAAHAVAAGKLLLEARTQVPHGHWLEWIGANCTISERTAQLYMQLAMEAPQLEAKAQRIADLTVAEAVKLLEPFKPPPAPKGGPARRGGSRKNAVAEEIKKDAMAVMQKAWDAASPQEREMFLSRVGNAPKPVL